MIRKALPDLGLLVLLLLLPLLLFAPVVLGSKTLLPVDNLFRDEPYRMAADEAGVEYPHNHLVSDLMNQPSGILKSSKRPSWQKPSRQ